MGKKKLSQKKRDPRPSASSSSLPEEDEHHSEQEEVEETHNQQPPKRTPPESEEEEVVRVEKKKPSVKKPIPPAKPQHPQSWESDSETHLSSPTDSGFIVKSVSPQPKKPTPAKRPMQELENKKKKKAKVVEEEGEKKDKKSGLGAGAIKRVWTEEDEVAILKRYLDFQSKNGADAGVGQFYEVSKKFFSADISKNQFVDKVYKLRRKYSSNVRSGKVSSSGSHESKCFKLSKKIWGGGKEDDGKNASGVDRDGKSNGSRRSRRNIVLNDAVAMAMKDPSKFWMMETMSILGDAKLKELEKKWKELRVAEIDLFVKRAQLIEEQAKMVLDGMKASKD